MTLVEMLVFLWWAAVFYFRKHPKNFYPIVSVVFFVIWGLVSIWPAGIWLVVAAMIKTEAEKYKQEADPFPFTWATLLIVGGIFVFTGLDIGSWVGVVIGALIVASLGILAAGDLIRNRTKARS